MRAKAVIDGNEVNIPQPAGGDGRKLLFILNGLNKHGGLFQEIAPAI